MKYTTKQIESFFNTTHAGVIMGADIAYKTISKETGDAVKIFLVVEDGIIKNAKFQACGSVVLYASLSAIVELLIDRTIEDASSINEKIVIREIKQVNRCDYGTVSFAVTSLQNTINAYFKKLNRLNGKEIERKPARARNLAPANLVSVYSEQEVKEEETNPFEAMVNPSKDEELTLPTPVTQEEVEEKVELEEDLTPIPLTVNDSNIIDSVPTKIEVVVVEDEVVDISEEETMREELLSPLKSKKIAEVEEKNDDVIDEIDSITAKLTDAITKLNFKFDIDE